MMLFQATQVGRCLQAKLCGRGVWAQLMRETEGWDAEQVQADAGAHATAPACCVARFRSWKAFGTRRDVVHCEACASKYSGSA